MTFRRKSDPGASLDMTPIIDMTFMLLIFFMVSSTFVKDMKLDLKRPGASTSERASDKALRIHIDKSGAVYVDGVATRPWMVQSKVRDALRAGGVRPVLVVADAKVPAERLIEVVDQCRLAGAADVGVATEREAG